jgi:hypothetical protein
MITRIAATASIGLPETAIRRKNKFRTSYRRECCQ